MKPLFIKLIVKFSLSVYVVIGNQLPDFVSLLLAVRFMLHSNLSGDRSFGK